MLDICFGVILVIILVVFFIRKGGDSVQEESVKEYKKQDLEFVAECKQALKNGEILTYECSW